MKLSIRNLEKALLSLEFAIRQPKDEFIRDSVIQRFEFTHELAWKSIRKQLLVELGSFE